MNAKPARRRIQVCESGLLHRHEEVLARLIEAGCIVETVPCLDRCTRCQSRALALVSGDFVAVSSPEGFLARLRL